MTKNHKNPINEWIDDNFKQVREFTKEDAKKALKELKARDKRLRKDNKDTLKD